MKYFGKMNSAKFNNRITSIYIPLFIFCFTFIWKFFYINTRDIALDEPFTIFHAQKSVVEIFRLLNNGPDSTLYTLLLHFWIKLFGIGAYSVRTLPLLFNASTAVILYIMGKKFYNIGTGLLMSGLFIISSYHFFFGLETRAYSLFSMGTALSLYHYLSIIKSSGNIKNIIFLIVANLIMIYSHYLGWFVIFMQFMLSFFHLKDRKIFKSIVGAIICSAILFLPASVIFIKQFLKSSQGTWPQPPTNDQYLFQIYCFLNARFVAFLILGLIILGLILRQKKKLTLDLLLLFLWWFVPYTIMFMISSKIPMFLDRYILYNSIGLYVFIGAIIHMLYKPLFAYIAGALILISMFFTLKINPQDYCKETQNAVNHIKEKEDDNSICLIYPYWGDLGFMYYYDRDIFRDVQNYESRLVENNIFHIWSLNEVKENIEIFKTKHIFYYMDGSTDTHIQKYLDSTHVRIDSIYYPKTIFVLEYIPKQKELPETIILAE